MRKYLVSLTKLRHFSLISKQTAPKAFTNWDFIQHFYLIALTLHFGWGDDVPSAEAGMVVTESEEHYTAPDDFDF